MIRIVLTAIIFASSLSYFGCSGAAGEEMVVLHAGSLSMPFQALARVFEAENRDVHLQLEAYGSRICARQVTDLGRAVDVLGSADSSVIRTLMMPDFADFCIDFTSNEMAITYLPDSRFSAKITAENWYDILLIPEVQYGHSDPNSDPCGYRTLLCWKLAESFYQRTDLYLDLSNHMPRKNIRSKEVDLLALLESGELDYIFIYRSVARQHGFPYITLPAQINLARADLAERYAGVSIEITGKEPGQTITKRGAPMVYGLTIPRTAKRRDLAVKFISFVLGPEGQRIMARHGQPQLQPPRVDNLKLLPVPLRKFFPDGQ